MKEDGNSHRAPTVFHTLLGIVEYSKVLGLPISSCVFQGKSSFGSLESHNVVGVVGGGSRSDVSSKNYILTQALDARLNEELYLVFCYTTEVQKGSLTFQAHLKLEPKFFPQPQASSSFSTVTARKGRPPNMYSQTPVPF